GRREGRGARAGGGDGGRAGSGRCGVAQQHPHDYAEVHEQQRPDREAPRGETRARRRELHLEERRAALALAVALGLLQCIEDERHASPAGMGLGGGGQERRVAAAEGGGEGDLRAYSRAVVGGEMVLAREIPFPAGYSRVYYF